ncbi:hypothetical protein DPEC_G00100140 [Dallia pectoralis]|uniref:Uncharacterized protein n=1 Tax=Dallia pectoralis TaxID=75939 RepID=A0ACC2GWU5_DALPE|nr:hypothetical protein DPEC_G00100140 [Dallia pectoralis]
MSHLEIIYSCLESKKVTTCEGSGMVHLECDNGVVILQNALYGRTDSQTCSQGLPQRQLTNTQCVQDGTLYRWSQRCNGKRMCEVNMIVNHDRVPHTRVMEPTNTWTSPTPVYLPGSVSPVVTRPAPWTVV